jgi:hypothetical protein
MELRRTGLITLRDRHLTIHDVARLRDTAGFNPGYLHLDAMPHDDATLMS